MRGYTSCGRAGRSRLRICIERGKGMRWGGGRGEGMGWLVGRLSGRL